MRHIKKFNESIDFTKSLEELVNTAIDNGDDLNEEG
jgi:ArsR family metal-binding transcriptional regulator